ncbi:MAG: hypothetical protein AB1556_07920 [Bacillota bacterium]
MIPSVHRQQARPAQQMQQFLAVLDEKSRAIVWYLWQHEHADLDALSAAAGLFNHMEVLLRIRETINPAAVNFYARPALELIPCRIDQATGKMIYYQWWLNRDLFLVNPSRNYLIDWLEDGEAITLILETAEQPDPAKVKLIYKNGLLLIKIPRRT